MQFLSTIIAMELQLLTQKIAARKITELFSRKMSIHFKNSF